jgi:transcriptional regulator with GAF, ATPase, and Fis domain
MENLFAFEDIEKREKEKTILLNLSNAINNIKDKQQLWEEVVTQLQPVFGFERDFTFLYLITADREHYRFFLMNNSALNNQSLAFKDVFRMQFPIKGAPYEQVIHKSVWIFAIEDMVGAYPDFKGFKLGLEGGQRQTAIIRLEYGGEVIGSLHLNSRQVDCFNETHIPLLKAIGKQVSIAIANILATDEIERQLIEITALKKKLEAENAYLQEAVDVAYNYHEIIGVSNEMQKVYTAVSQVAHTDSTVLILGETGTGKELVARAIHNASPRKEKLLIKVNCAALPANLIESELFGHERGSFTGATERRIGKFELANNGTLFLDEIGELPLELQAKLLRALQEKEIERIGGRAVIKCDVRIIAATNRMLADEVKAQRFRSDLFFRLNIFPIKLPPLRSRREDIPLLANHFLQKFSKKMNKKITGINTATLQAMMTYHWPGNIRELENLIERAVIINKTKTLQINLQEYSQQQETTTTVPGTGNIFQVKTYRDAEREIIIKTIEICKGKIRGEGGAAQLLKINPNTLESKMKKLGIVKKSLLEVSD